MSKRDFKNKVYGELARVTKAMANSHRMEIIDLLAQGPSTVENIAIQTGISMANASQHLQVLKTARLAEITRKGNFIFYTLTDQKVFKAWRSIRDLGMNSNAEVERLIRDYREKHHSLHAISIDDLQKKIATGKVIVLDVRSEEEYDKGHIYRAISIPIDRLSDRLNELARRKEIIAYCRGPLCVFADEAVEILWENGYTATRMAEGFPDWAALGLPVEIT